MSADFADPVVFARRVLGVSLWPHQAEAARSGAFVTSVAAARRTGKSTLAEVLAAHAAFTHPGCVVLVVSATQDAARRLTESIAARLNSRRLTRGAVVDDFAHRITLGNGSRIVSLPASAKQVRGYGANVALAICDEAGFVPGDVWTALHYTALDERGNGSRILLAGTPWGGVDHFFRSAFLAGRDGDPDHASFQWTFEANPKLDRAYLERMRDRVSPAEYAAEVLGEWSDAVGSLFPRDVLDRNVADFEPWSFEDLRGPGRLLLGVDWGVSFDRSSAVALARFPVGRDDEDPRPTFGVAALKVWPAGAPLAGVVNEIGACSARWSWVTAETNGVGAMPAQELRVRLIERKRALDEAGDGMTDALIWNAHATSARSKATGYGAVLSLLEQNRLVLPRDPDLLRQLAGLRFEQGERGMVRIGAENAGTHDDVADALMLAAGPYARDGRLDVAVSGFARSHPEPFAVPDVAMTSTSAGVRVPVRPFLASPLGGEVTEPRRGPNPGVVAAEDFLQEARRAVAVALNGKRGS